jgi:4-amino-4-deoxy-L-arabinose transferase-like glycosyltransferase
MNLDQTRARRLVVGAVVAAFLLRLGFGLVYWIEKPLSHDEREYLALAESLAAGRGFTYSSPGDGTAQQFGRAPGYPMFLAAIGAGRQDATATPLRVKVAQSIVGAATVWLIALIARRAAGERAAAVAAVVAACYPPLVWFPAYVLSETLYSFFALAPALVLQVAVDRAVAHRSSRHGSPLSLAAGVLAGAAVLVRPAMLFFLPLAVLWLMFRRMPVLAIALIAGAAAVITPWTVRNYRVHDRFVLVASEGGVTFWTGNHPLARGEGDLAANPAIKQAELGFRAAHPGLSAEELEPLYYRDALANISAHPGWWLGLIVRKAFYTVVPFGPSYALHSMKYRVATTASYLALLPFAWLGVRRLWGTRQAPTAVFLLAGSAILVSLVFFPQERFRIPVIDPVLIICAAASGRLARL